MSNVAIIVMVTRLFSYSTTLTQQIGIIDVSSLHNQDDSNSYTVSDNSPDLVVT